MREKVKRGHLVSRWYESTCSAVWPLVSRWGPVLVYGSVGAAVAAAVPPPATSYVVGAAVGVFGALLFRRDRGAYVADTVVPVGRAVAVSGARLLSPAEVLSRARHEAGHAVLAYYHAIDIAEGTVSSSPVAQVGGQIRYGDGQLVQTWHDEWVRIQLAWGGEAVQRVDGYRLTGPSTYDAAAAQRSADHLFRIHADLGFSYGSAHELSGKALDAAVTVVSEQLAAVDAVARLLVAHVDQCVPGNEIAVVLGSVWVFGSFLG
ncbi:hypothetical protein ONA92_26310 [Mycobacteroides salmoniphilum]|uniref:hypothetical protein n=1 Tax=Mycobacteroides salmoniphilum TaxID=404941 RepID=UPI00356231D6